MVTVTPDHPRPLPLAGVTERKPRATRHRVMAAVVAGYLLAAAIAGVAGDRLPVPTWLALHLLVLGGATNAVFVWSRHFAQALLHTKLGSERAASGRLVVLNVGAVSVLSGVPLGWSPLVAFGAALVTGAVVAHGASLVRLVRGATLPGRLAGCARYYVASAAALAVGAVLGGLLATVPSAHSAGLHLAHAHANVFGWLGLAVLGTSFMLWPAVLRTRLPEGVPGVAQRTLVLTAAGLAVAVAALAAVPGDAAPRLAAVGVAAYLAGVALSLRPFLQAARQRPPHNAAAWMLAASITWFAVALAVDVVGLARGWSAGQAALSWMVPVLALGLVGQVLVAALTFLLPVTIGGGPAGNRRVAAVLEAGWVARAALLNLGVLIAAVAPDGGVRDGALALAGVSLAAAVPLLLAGVVVSRRPLPAPGDAGPDPAPVGPVRPGRPFDWAEHLGVACVLAVVAALVVTLAPGGTAGGAPAGAPVQTVEVTLTEFAVQPATIQAAEGARVVLRVRNAGTVPHDLRFPGGLATPQLAAGESADLDLGLVSEQLDGWCTLAGHKAAGMTMTITPGGPPLAASEGANAAAHDHGADAHAHGSWWPEAAGDEGPEWQPYDPTLEPAPGGTAHDVTLRVVETDVEVAPGVRQAMWTFNGTVPGPTLRGKVGDLFTVRLVNDGTIPHSVDFHASRVAPDVMMRSIAPGEELVYSFVAERAGAWMYHCSSAPMLQHVAMGMYGAVVIDPVGLPPVDRELVLVQSEIYLAENGELPALTRMTDADDDHVVFNGSADQYARSPIVVRPRERLRIWVVAAGPSKPSAFHVVGSQFDTVFKEGGYLLRPSSPEQGGAQVLDLQPGSGGFVELTLPEPGRYPIVTHRLADAARGATGVLLAEE